MAARDQVRRLPHGLCDLAGRGAAHQPPRPRLHVQAAGDRRRRDEAPRLLGAARRRSGGAPRRRARQLPGTPTGDGGAIITRGSEGPRPRIAARTTDRARDWSTSPSISSRSTANRSLRAAARGAQGAAGGRSWAAARRRIRYSEHVVGQGTAFFEQATRLGVEGIVSKRRDARVSARPACRDG